jgi:hypothetical protein
MPVVTLQRTSSQLIPVGDHIGQAQPGSDQVVVDFGVGDIHMVRSTR